MMRRRPAPGGGMVVEVEPGNLVGWINRFAGRNSGLAGQTADARHVLLTATDGTTADLAVPFAPMTVGDREPVEAMLDHLEGMGTLGLILVRAGAHSVGIARNGVIRQSSTHRPYVQGRTAAGGWSQQRYARRRDNQLTASLHEAAETAARVVLPFAGRLDGLVVGGDAGAIEAVLADRRLEPLLSLPRRMFGDIPEPRREVLEMTAARSLTVEITVREPELGTSEV